MHMHRPPPLLYFGVKGPLEEQRVVAAERSTMTRRSRRTASFSVLQARYLIFQRVAFGIIGKGRMRMCALGYKRQRRLNSSTVKANDLS